MYVLFVTRFLLLWWTKAAKNNRLYNLHLYYYTCLYYWLDADTHVTCTCIIMQFMVYCLSSLGWNFGLLPTWLRVLFIIYIRSQTFSTLMVSLAGTDCLTHADVHAYLLTNTGMYCRAFLLVPSSVHSLCINCFGRIGRASATRTMQTTHP